MQYIISAILMEETRPHNIPMFYTETDASSGQESDVRIVTSGGPSIPAHSRILASRSGVLESILQEQSHSTNITIPILGVPYEAVITFVKYLYSSVCSEEEMDAYGIHLLALSHVYSVRQLKRACTQGLGVRLNMENVVDVLQLSRLCDAPGLYLKCLKMVTTRFKDVEATEGWTFLQENDPWLELEILQFLDESEMREKQRRKNKKEINLYMELNEAVECLEHICTDGCTSVGPYDMEPHLHREPCDKFPTCRGVQLLIRHFATCKKRVKGDCCRCKRMWQLLRLHSAVCDHTDHCRVPLCRQFKLRVQIGERNEERGKWRILARKVVSAKAMSSLSPSKRK